MGHGAPMARINSVCNLSFFLVFSFRRRRIPDRPRMVALCELFLGVFPFFVCVCDIVLACRGSGAALWGPPGVGQQGLLHCGLLTTHE